MEPGGAEGQVAGAGGWGGEGFAFAQGDEQKADDGGLVPAHAFALDPGGFSFPHDQAVRQDRTVFS